MLSNLDYGSYRLDLYFSVLFSLSTKVFVVDPKSELVFSQKYAVLQGYKISVLKGYNINKLDSVFTDYVNDLYKELKKDINKILLKHLLGRFGMNIIKPTTQWVNEDKLSLIVSTR